MKPRLISERAQSDRKKHLPAEGVGSAPASPPAPGHAAPTRLIHCPRSRKRRPGEPTAAPRVGWGGLLLLAHVKAQQAHGGEALPPKARGAAGAPSPEPPEARTFPPSAAGTEAPPSQLGPLPPAQGQYLLWALPGDVGLPPCLTPKPGALLLNSGGTRKQLPGTAEKSQVRPAPPAGGGQRSGHR